MSDNTAFNDKDLDRELPRALIKVNREYQRARKGEKKELYCFARLILDLEYACKDLEDDEDTDWVVIPRSVTPEMLIEAKEQMTLAAKRLAAFAARIEEKIEAQVRRAA